MSTTGESIYLAPDNQRPFWRTGKFILATIAASAAGMGGAGFASGSYLNKIQGKANAKTAVHTARCLELVKKNTLPDSATAIVRLSLLSAEQRQDCGLIEPGDYDPVVDQDLFPGLPNLTTQDSGNEYKIRSGDNGADYSLTAKVVRVIPGHILAFETPSNSAQERSIKRNEPLEMIAVRQAADAEVQLPTEKDLKQAIIKDDFVASHGNQGNYSNEIPLTSSGIITGLLGSFGAWAGLAWMRRKR